MATRTAIIGGLKSYRQVVAEQVDALVGVVNGCIRAGVKPDLRVYLEREAVSGHDVRMRRRPLVFDCEMEHLRRYPVC